MKAMFNAALSDAVTIFNLSGWFVLLVLLFASVI